MKVLIAVHSESVSFEENESELNIGARSGRKMKIQFCDSLDCV